MKIGVFDSGLGGLYILKSLRAAMPEYDYVYLGDTLNLPYGKRSRETIYAHSKAAVEFLFRQDCHIVIIACNTASAAATRQLQQEYLPDAYPERRILSVVIPMLETAIDAGHERIGLIGTDYIVSSNVYEEELKKINPAVQLFSAATPLLVPLIEDGGAKYLPEVLGDYIAPMTERGIDALILGCTHYAHLKPLLQDMLPEGTAVLCQDEIIPPKFADYLSRHPEHETVLSRGGTAEYFVSDMTEGFQKNASDMMGEETRIMKAHLV